MNELKELILKRIQNLKEIIQEKETALLNTPEGVINITTTAQNGTQYYYKRNPTDSKKTYLKKKNMPLIQQLCQKDYDQQVLLSAKRELHELERFNKTFSQKTYEEIYDSLHISRQKLIHPVILPDKDFINEWENVKYNPKSFRDDMPEYLTDKGERVRSKTEILIANALNKHCIPYRYECPLRLNGYGKIHPDFTVLNIRLRQVFYWEHMGKMDDPEYLENALQRISMYEQNNIYPGETLILTHETLRHPINTKDIERVLTRYLL